MSVATADGGLILSAAEVAEIKRAHTRTGTLLKKWEVLATRLRSDIAEVTAERDALKSQLEDLKDGRVVDLAREVELCDALDAAEALNRRLIADRLR